MVMGLEKLVLAIFLDEVSKKETELRLKLLTVINCLKYFNDPIYRQLCPSKLVICVS